MSVDRLMLVSKVCQGGCGATVLDGGFCGECEHFARDFFVRFVREERYLAGWQGSRLHGLMEELPREDVGVAPMPLLARMRSAAWMLLAPALFAASILVCALTIRGAVDLVRWLIA